MYLKVMVVSNVDSDPDSCFPSLPCARGRTGRVYYNHLVALPLSLLTIRERLQAPVYYRQLDAVKWDLLTIVENAILFNGHGSEISKQAENMSEIFLQSMMEGEGTQLSAGKNYETQVLSRLPGMGVLGATYTCRILGFGCALVT